MEHKEIKQRFFAFRNGMLADNLRRQCALPHKTIFGLLLPQIKEIAAECGKNEAMAARLWEEDCRESRLLAILISTENPLAKITQLRSSEEADILCHTHLRHLPNAADLASSLGYLSARLARTISPE